MRSVRRIFTVFLTAFALLASGLALQLITPLEFGIGASPAGAAAPVKTVKALKPPAAAKLGTPSVSEAKAQKAGKPERVRELGSLRTETSKSYVMSDGATQLELSTDPMHYRDAKGAWKQIDTKVVPGSGDDSFTNDANGFSSRFGKSTDRLVAFQDGNASISLGAAGDAKPVEVTAKGSSVTFTDVFGAADVRYGVTSSSLKEEIVLDQAPTADDATSFVFELKTRGLEARALKDGSIGFYKKGGDKAPEYVMPAPYMYDSSKDALANDTGQSDDVTQTLEQSGSTTTLTVTADRDWLTDPDRNFPVVIDPTITVVPAPSDAQDTRIYQGSPTTNYATDPNLLAGSNGTNAHRSLLKFDLSAIPTGTTLRSADLEMHFSRAFTYTSSPVGIPITAYGVAAPWNETNATWANMSTDFSTSSVYTQFDVDNSDLLSTSFAGPWKDVAYPDSYGGSLSHAGSATTPDTFTWDARVPTEGNYKVWAWYPPRSTRGTPSYTVTGDKGSVTTPVDQTAGAVTGLWATIAPSLHFSPDAVGKVTMKRQAGTTATTPVADAIRFAEYATQTKDYTQVDAWHSFAVTSLVDKWVKGTSTNYGFMVKGTDDTVAGPNGGTYYDASEDAFGGETANRPKLVITYDQPGVTLNAPKVINADGPELTWSKYKDPSPETDDDLVEYQIWRGCRTLPVGTCDRPAGDYFDPRPVSDNGPGYDLVDTVPADVTTWTDHTAQASTAGAAATYNYWIVAKTASDGAAKSGRASSNVQAVTTPRQGRVMRVLDAMRDTTLSAARPTTVIPQPDNHQWLQVGNSHATNGDERAVIEFDTSAIKQSVKVTGSRLELYESSGTGAGATVDLHALTPKDFDEGQATWNQANSTSPWTKPGGDYDTTILDNVLPGISPTRLTFASSGLTSKVQSWVNNNGENHGFLLKTRDETVSQQYINIVNRDSGDTLFRPRLYVEHLVKNDTETIEANELPERFVPGTTITTPVTVTNTSDATWPAGLQLSYRWTEPESTTDLTVSGERNFAPLGRALEPGESVKLDIPVRTPINSDTGAKRLSYDFYFDLWTGSEWYSTAHPLSSSTARPAQGCSMVTNGLLCVDRVVEDPTSSQLGLEKSFSYTGEETGGGAQMLTNLYSGNAVWSYDAMTNPSIGPSTFVRLAYNSMDATDPGTGYGISVQASTLTRLGSRLSVPNGGSTSNLMTFIDGDGTTHTYKLDTQSSTKLTYTRPAGVALDLTRDLTADTAHQWVFTRPDGTRFFFNQSTGLQTSVVDRNGNTLSYFYDGSGRLTSLKDSSNRTTLTLGWSSAGLLWIRDLSGRALKFNYNSTHQLTKLEDGGAFDTATQTFGTATAVKSFPLGYTETSVNGNAKLNSVGDPRGANTAITYYTSTENSTYALWPKKYTDRRGNDTTFSYIDPDASAAKDLQATVTDINGSTPSVTVYRMDGYGRTTSITDANSKMTKLGWDTDHNVIRLEEPNGAVSTWQYDENSGYPLNVKDALAVKNGDPGIKLNYHRLDAAPGQPYVLDSKTSAAGRTDTFTYDATGNLKTVKNGLGFGPTYVYNTNGTLAKVTDARGGVVTYDNFDTNGYPQLVTDPVGSKTDFVYDVRGNVMQVKDALSQVTAAEYDAFGRPTAITTPFDGAITRTTATTYDVNDNIKKETAPNGAETSYAYDAADNLTTKSIPDNNVTGRKLGYKYDALSRVVEETAPEGMATPLILDDFVTRYTYDPVGQVTKVESPFKYLTGTKTAVTTYEYDSVGNKISEVDPNKNATAAGDYTSKMVYDLNHQVTAITDAVGYTSKNEYDRDGLLVAEIDALGNKKRTVYDAAGQPTEVHVPHTPVGSATEDRVTKTTYDEVGNVTRTTRPSGKYDETVYDANNRPVQSKSAFDANDAVYNKPASTFTKYDAIGQKISQSDPTFGTAGTQWTDYTYFDSGDVKKSTDPWKIATEYQYNAIGQQTSRKLTTATDDATRTMSWGFYPDGSMASRTDKAAQQPVVIVDNSDTWQAKLTGTWGTSTSSANRYGADYLYHGARAAGTTGADDTFTWAFTPEQSGDFDVYVSCPVRTDTTTAAVYSVTHSTGTSSATVDQKACTSDTPWIKLGNYTFSGGSTKTVVLKPSALGVVAADAVKFVSTSAVDERAFSYEYDANGQQTKVIDQGADAAVDTFATTYDGLGRASQVNELKNGTAKRITDYSYDLNSNMLSSYAHRAAGAGNAEASQYSEYTWDGRDMVDTAKIGKTPTSTLDTFAYTYDARGKRSTLTKPNGNLTKYTYYEDGLARTMVENTDDAHGNQRVASHTLKYNADGDRSQDVEILDTAGATGTLDQTSAFTYTPSQKLKSITRTGGDKGSDESYVYDAAGNTTSQTIGATTTAMTYDRNRLTQTVSGSTTVKHQYDALGRDTTSVVGSQVIERNAYDGYDRRLRQQKWDAAGVYQGTKSNTYDPFDRTVTESVRVTTQPTIEKRFIYLGLADDVAVEEQANTAGTYEVSKVYAYGPEGEKLSLVNTPVNDSTTKKSYYGNNPHGDVETLTDSSTGQTTSTYRYTAYGTADKTGTTGEDAITGDPVKDADLVNPYRFSGKRFEGMSGSYDMGFRDYNPGLNRFSTRDMYNGALDDMALGTDPWNTNRYAFAGGNPISRVELDGHWGISIKSIKDKVADKVSDTAHAVGDAASATGNFVEKHKGTIAGIATGIVVYAGCTAGSGGMGAVGCGYVAGAAGSAVSTALDEDADHSIGGFAKSMAIDGAVSAATAGVGKVAAPVLSKFAAPMKSAASNATGRVSSAMRNASSKLAGGCSSFAGVTAVLMADGSEKAIEDIAPGDKVLATDPETGKQLAKQVTRVWVHDDTLIDLIVDGDVITTTEDHPFWNATDGEFQRVDELEAGEQVLTDDGHTVSVLGLRPASTRTALAYNLTVEGIHTYHVGSRHVLVHNTAACTVGPHGKMPSPRPGMQSHHGVNDIWAKSNMPGYKSSQAPAVLMPEGSHRATFGVFNRIRVEISQRQGTPGTVDWARVSPGTAWRIAEEQFAAANTAPAVVDNYFGQWNQYIGGLTKS